MIKIFFTNVHPGYRTHPILYKKNGLDFEQLGINTKVEQFNFEFEEVLSPKEADVLLVPHSFSTITNEVRDLLHNDYLNHLKYGKPFVITLFGDNSHNSHIDFGVLLKVSAYKETVRTNEVVIPAYSEDWSSSVEVLPPPISPIPIVSFCGMSKFPSFISYCKYLAKILISVGRIDRLPGLYFRRKYLKILEYSKEVKTVFIHKSRFAGIQSDKTKQSDYLVSRNDFYKSIMASHFVLAIRGDGNYSNRFFEAMSFGRVPVSINTDLVLPLERVLDYSKFSVIVNISDSHNLALYISQYYKNISNLNNLQSEIIHFYRNNLRFDVSFIKILQMISDKDTRVYAKE